MKNLMEVADEQLKDLIVNKCEGEKLEETDSMWFFIQGSSGGTIVGSAS